MSYTTSISQKNGHRFKQEAHNKDIREDDEIEDVDREKHSFGSIYLRKHFISSDTMLQHMKICD